MSLHPHQHAALVARLREPDLAGLSADAAFAALSGDKNLLGLRALSFLPQPVYDALSPKRRHPRLVPVGAEVEKQFPGGVPGFPNKLRRADFDAAFAEARR